MSTDKLPPLPESHPYGFDLPGEHPLFKAEQMRAYGQQCRDAALREAAELCEQIAQQYMARSRSHFIYDRCVNALRTKMKERR
jgi:hypothetical protein